MCTKSVHCSLCTDVEVVVVVSQAFIMTGRHSSLSPPPIFPSTKEPLSFSSLQNTPFHFSSVPSFTFSNNIPSLSTAPLLFRSSSSTTSTPSTCATFSAHQPFFFLKNQPNLPFFQPHPFNDTSLSLPSSNNISLFFPHLLSKATPSFFSFP